MTSLNELTIQAISTPKRFNWPWFVELCVCGILALFFLFYFNRLFATILSYGVRTYAWHHYRVWVDIQALQISLLGGRIFFKGVTYHGENETILVNHGYITWRYWFRCVKQVDLLMSEKPHSFKKDDTTTETLNHSPDASSVEFTGPDEELGTSRKQDNSEARIAVYVTGVEWFIYNRTPLYDALLRDNAVEADDEGDKSASSTGVASSEALKLHIRSKLRRRPKTGESLSSDFSRSNNPDLEKPLTCGDDSPEPIERRSTASSQAAPVEDDVTALQSLLVQLLPIYLECSRVAVSIGNEHTRALLVTTVDKAKGHIDARGCGPNDLFRQIFDFDVEHPIVQMRPNPDFVGTQLSVAEHIITNSDAVATKKRWWRWNLHLQRRKYKAMNAIRNLVPGFQSSVESLHHRKHHIDRRVSYSHFAGNDSDGGEWHGLSRYLDDNDDDDHQAWAHIDYARFSTIVDCPSVHLTFYWDSPGRVKADHINPVATDKRRFDINGVEGPAYGLDLTIKGGSVNYGPWADRLRAEIQSVFFPASYKSSVPAKPLKVGQWRQSSVMIIRIDIEEEVKLRVPTKESSKDWRWRGRATAVREAATIRQQRQKRHFRLKRGNKGLLGPDIRPFGWIAVSVSSDSSVRYEMDMAASHEGYRNQLYLDLKDTKATSSVNHAELWRCANHQLECDLSNPLVWNSQHTWNFNIRNQSMDMFLLRDHMFLLTDLIADFTAGAKSNYMTFVPFEYKIGLSFDNLKLFLNANDFNIVDNPCDLDSNAFLILGIRNLVGNVDIPMKYFSASESSVHFRANGDNIFLDLKTPIWNTLHSFAKDDNMASLKTLVMGGSYNYRSATSAQATDSLFMDIVGGSPVFHLQGFLIRYFMNVKENYFGEDLHFRTLEEYQSRIGPGNRFLAEDQRRTVKKENDLDVVLNVRAEESCALMPTNIYTREENLRVDVMLVEADMRFTNYYMDLQVNSSPIEISTEKNVPQKGQDKIKKDTSGCQLYISAANVYGHRLFGAPPTEPTYVCNWDFDIGAIFGECSVEFVKILIAAVQAFMFTLDDVENTLPVTRATDLNDVTFLRARAGDVRIWIITDTAAFLVQTGQSTVSFDDWAGQHFSRNLRANIPSITVAAIDSTGASHRSGKTKKHNRTLACIQTSVHMVNIDKKANFKYQRQLQQDHIRFHDSRTDRAIDLLHDRQPIKLSSRDAEWAEEPPAMPIPNLPPPLSNSDRTGQVASNIDSRHRSSNSDRHPFSASISGGEQSSTVNPLSYTRNSPLADGTVPSMPGGGLFASRSSSYGQNNRLNSAFDAPFTSPWIGPQFTLRQVEPDLSQMPSITLDDNKSGPQEFEDSGAEQDYADSDESLSHAAISCNLPGGVRGFCSPFLFPAIADILKSLDPNDAHLLLDNIQQSMTANINSLNTEKQGEKIDLALRIPVAAIRLVDPGSHSKQPPDLLADQYDLTVSQIRLTGRIAPTFARQAHGQMKQNIFLLQTSIREIDISAAEKLKSPIRDIAELSVSIHDIALWLSVQDEIRGKLQSSYFNVSTGGSTVDRLSMLAERCRAMIASITEQFSHLDQKYAVRHLIYHLSLLNTDEAEPVFLSKPSYVLRSTAEHIRLADSWRMLARFRHRLNSMPLDHSMDLVEHESCLFEQQPEKARQQILESIDRWKTWDQNHEACGPLLVTMFGKSDETGQATMKVDDVEIGIYIGQISVVLDPGPQQTELLLQSGDISISQKPVFERDSGHSRKSPTRKSRMRVQIWFAELRLDVDWNLIELARSLVKQINLSTAAQSAPKVRRHSTAKPAFEELDLMVVAGTDIAAADVRMLNLNLSMATRNVKASVAVQLFEMNSTMSVLIDSSSAYLKVANQRAKLLNWKLNHATIYGQYQQNHRSLKSPNSARFAASCDRLRFDMKEDVLSVLEVVNAVIRDEAAIVQEIVNSIEQKTAVAESSSKSQALRFEDAHVAFFLNNYKLQFCLLPSLHYSITGTVARTSIVPQEQASRYIVHVDIKKNTHTLVEPGNNRRVTAAALEIPPISGRFAVNTADQQIKINARSTLERVTIEAQAVQACIEAAYQPRNVARLKDCQAVVNRIQQSIKRTQEHSLRQESAAPSKPETTKVLLYCGHAVFEGFDIHCSAPAARDQDYRADLKFGIRETTLRIHNYRSTKRIPLAQPHFEVNLRQAYIGLYRQDGRGLHNYGNFGMGMKMKGITQAGNDDDDYTQNYQLKSEGLQLDLFAETASLATDIATFLQGRIIELTTAEDRKKMKPLRRLTLATNDVKAVRADLQDNASHAASPSNFFDATFSLDLNLIRIRWIVDENLQAGHGRVPEDLVFSISQIDLQTQRESSARLTISNTQLQTVPKKQEDPTIRTANSALLPEMIFNAAHFSTKKDRRFAFQAAGKALDLRLAANGILPISAIQKSLARAASDVRSAQSIKISSEESTERPVTNFLGDKRLSSLLIDADFAGAIVTITPRPESDGAAQTSPFNLLKGPKRPKAGRYAQAVQIGGAEDAVLRAPGIAVKVEYLDTTGKNPTLSTELKVAASNNTLAPSVVPLILEIYSSVKEIIGEDESQVSKPDIKTPAQKYLSDAASADKADPAAILGKVKLNAGIWVQRQEFSLTCQPIARVAATARFDEIFVRINSVQEGDQERFFSIITTFNKLQTSVQHVYSRESTASFEVDAIVMSLMNSKHVSAKNGISAILNVSPMRASLNAKQMQDFLLFREIWYPAEMRQRSKPPAPAPTAADTQAYTMQRYHELAATAALPWHAVVSIHELKLEVDFGQSLGKSSFMISKLWASSKKNSDWEQNLCIGFERVGIDSSGRTSGFIELKDFRARTSIRWPVAKNSDIRAPLVQASVGFGHLRLKTAFDYQPFAVADVSSFEFLMYNVRPTKDGDSDRLVGILDGGKVQVFCISAAAAQALSIVQAFERLVQEKREAFNDSLQELEKLLRRKSIFPTTTAVVASSAKPAQAVTDEKRQSHRLHTDVVVTLKAIDIGAFPNTFFDNQILKIEAVDAQARFAVATVEERLNSGLGMTLGEVRVALSAISKANTKALGEVEISEVIDRATSSKGGTILKVPRVVASMQTWQEPQSHVVEYIFRSTFQGKVDVGWNYSRIRFIRSMWETHSQALAHRLGKPLPPAAVKITTEPPDEGSQKPGNEKITAVVNVPQSTKFQYLALEPPIIDTPQLRDMGEATPPLEWIGLHRDKLPNVTHSIIIVTLLEVAKEVEDAYTRILGTG